MYKNYVNKQKEQLTILNQIKELLKNVPWAGTLNISRNREYVNYVKENHSEIVELLYKVADIRGNEVLNFFIMAPMDNSIGLKIKNDTELGFTYMSVTDFVFDVNKNL